MKKIQIIQKPNQNKEGGIKMKEKNVAGVLETTISKIKELVDVSTVIGEPITAGANTIIPISTVKYGFASGGSDFPSKNSQDLFGGGGGAGITIKPIAFLVINGNDVTVKPIVTADSPADNAIAMIPEVINKLTTTVEKFIDKKDKKADTTAEAE